MSTSSFPPLHSKWVRDVPHDPEKGPYNEYTVLHITNVAHDHPDHPPQVVYQGDNGHIWSLEASKWPGSLREVPNE